MTQEQGEDSPKPAESATSAVSVAEVRTQRVRKNQSDAMDDVSPTESLFPLTSGSEKRVNGETFEERVKRFGIDPDSAPGRLLYREFQSQVEKQETEQAPAEESRDEDGAIYFENGEDTLPYA